MKQDKNGARVGAESAPMPAADKRPRCLGEGRGERQRYCHRLFASQTSKRYLLTDVEWLILPAMAISNGSAPPANGASPTLKGNPNAFEKETSAARSSDVPRQRIAANSAKWGIERVSP